MDEPLRCEDFLDHYSAYRDGAEPELVTAMTDHLAVCAACRAHDRAVREGVETLREDLVAPSPEFEAKLKAKLESGWAPPEPAPRVPPVALTAIALLVAALTAIGIRDKAGGVVSTAQAEEQPMLLAKPRALAGIPFVAFEPNR